MSAVGTTPRTGEAAASSAAAEVAAAAAAEAPLFDGMPLILGVIAINVFYVRMRICEQDFGWYAGLDSFAPEFVTYWMTILYIEEPVELISFLALISWMWKTRDQDLANLQPREELHRIFYLMSWIFVYALACYWGASFFTEQDAAWNMTVVRDSDFNPSNIIEFYMAYPMYIIMGVGGFMYARTRLPTYACKGWSVAYVLLFVGPSMSFPSVAFDEWGHTFWPMEELFVASQHWMFVFLGWFSLALFGVSLQIVGRVGELCEGYEHIMGLEPGKSEEDYSEEDNAEYRIWYGTNRRPKLIHGEFSGYSSERDDKIRYGQCRVFVPKSHKMGPTGSPWWKRLLTRTDDDPLKLLATEPYMSYRFWNAIAAQLQPFSSQKKRAVVFIHGFNVSFEEAALRTAQIGSDLKIKTPMAFFSWPSRGTLGV